MLKTSFDIGLILSSLLFYADFDHSFDAAFSKGEGKALIEVDQYEPFITSGGKGKFGEAAEFIYEDKLETIWTKDVARYPAKGNFPYAHGEAYDGAIGMWLQVDMELLKERSLIWLDPVHLLSESDPDNGKIWMDFVTSELPDTPIFRFGATTRKNAITKQNNPKDNHVIIVPDINFSGDAWHHVVGTWKNLNSGEPTGVLHLYFDGILVGQIENFEHSLEWKIDDFEIRIGLGFKGKIDDFFVLDRFLTDQDVAEIHASDASLGAFLGISKE